MKPLPLSTLLAALVLALVATGCVGRTGKVGKPISAYYETQLATLKLGESTPDDLKRCFTFTVTNQPVHSLAPNIAAQAPASAAAARPGPVIVHKRVLVTLVSARMENGHRVEIYEIEKGGGMDVASFVMWGYVAYNKDQEMLFRFEDGKLAAYDSIVLPDPVVAETQPISKTPK